MADKPFWNNQKKRWAAQVTDPATGKKVTRTKLHYDEAMEALNELKRTLHSGVQLSKNPTFEAWVENWLENAPITEKTKRGYRNSLAYALPVLGKKRMGSITTDDVERVYSQMRKKGLSQNSVVNAHRVIHRAFELALARRTVQWNPANTKAINGNLTPELNPHDQLDGEEARKVLAQASREGDLRELLHAALLLMLGLRRHELLALRWEDVREDEGLLKVRHSLTADTDPKLGARKGAKTNRHVVHELDAVPGDCTRHEAQVLPLPEPLPELFGRVRAEAVGPWVFPRPSTPALPRRGDYDLGKWKALCARAEVPEITLHGARGSCGSVLLAMGVEPVVIAQILDHKDVATTLKHYAKARSEAGHAAIGSLGAEWADVLALPPASLESDAEAA